MFFYLHFLIASKMKKTNILLCTLFFLATQKCIAQTSEKHFTHADTLRGSVTPERAWWDVLKYDIDVKPDYENKTIEGKCQIKFKVDKNNKTIKRLIDQKDRNFVSLFMQIDLQQPL